MLRPCLRRPRSKNKKVQFAVLSKKHDQRWSEGMCIDDMVGLMRLLYMVKRGEAKEEDLNHAIYAILLRRAVRRKLQSDGQYLALVKGLYKRVCHRVKSLYEIVREREKRAKHEREKRAKRAPGSKRAKPVYVHVPRPHRGTWRKVEPAVVRGLCELVSRITPDELLCRARHKCAAHAVSAADAAVRAAAETARAAAKTARAAVLDANDVKTARAVVSLLRLSRQMS